MTREVPGAAKEECRAFEAAMMAVAAKYAVPKVLDDSVTEAVSVPATAALDDFLAALHLWRWQRRAAGRSAGSVPSAGFGHTSHGLAPAKVRTT